MIFDVDKIRQRKHKTHASHIDWIIQYINRWFDLISAFDKADSRIVKWKSKTFHNSPFEAFSGVQRNCKVLNKTVIPSISSDKTFSFFFIAKLKTMNRLIFVNENHRFFIQFLYTRFLLTLHLFTRWRWLWQFYCRPRGVVLIKSKLRIFLFSFSPSFC